MGLRWATAQRENEMQSHLTYCFDSELMLRVFEVLRK